MIKEFNKKLNSQNYNCLKSFYFCKKFLMEQIKDRIVQESLQLFYRRGIRLVTMDDIANHLGISKRTLYEHFNSKDALVYHCALQKQHFLEICRSHASQKANNVIELIFNIICEFQKVFQNINPNFFIDLKKYHHKVWLKCFLEYEKKHIEEIEELIKRGINEGLFLPYINTSIVAHLFQFQLRGISEENIFPTEEFKSDVVFVNIVVTFLRGISTPEGIQIIDNIVHEQLHNSKQKKE